MASASGPAGQSKTTETTPKQAVQGTCGALPKKGGVGLLHCTRTCTDSPGTARFSTLLTGFSKYQVPGTVPVPCRARTLPSAIRTPEQRQVQTRSLRGCPLLHHPTHPPSMPSQAVANGSQRVYMILIKTTSVWPSQIHAPMDARPSQSTLLIWAG